MSSWDTPAEPTSDPVPTDSTDGYKPGPPRDEAKIALAREKGWAPQEHFNYEKPQPAAQQSADSAVQPDCDNGDMPAWMAKAAKYEWMETYGDVGPEMPKLEQELFGSELRLKKGYHFDALCSIKVVAEATERPAPIRSFDDAGLHPIMVDNVRKSGYEIPTPIQAYTVPAVLKGRDVVAVAQTGSGKTAAFMIPTLSKLMGKAKKLCAARPNHLRTDYDHRRERVRAEPLVVIVAPTRELCIQIFDEARRLCYRSMLRPCVAYGGGPLREQRQDLEKGCDVLIATPGRLRDFMKDPQLLTLKRLRFTIIDEADEMLHEDWQEDLEEILSGADANMDSQHQYLLFSATFNKKMRVLARKYLAADYVRIRIGRAGSTVRNIKQQIVWVDADQKKQALYDLLIASPPARTLIFCKTKKMVDIVDDFLFNQGLPTTSLHSDRLQYEREDAIRAFRQGSSPILIATAVSARGIDVRHVMHVINFDLPEMDYGGPDEYIHRIGRTGRVGNEGLATSFYNERDEPMAPFLAKILVENGWEVPDFLEEYKPADAENLDFDDDSGNEENELAAANGSSQANSDGDDAWSSAPAQPAASSTDNVWGSSIPPQAAPAADGWSSAAGGNSSSAGCW